jgi:lipopolysaccharide export system permease protein
VSFRTSPPLLERYVLRESILPFFLGFCLVTFLFILDFLFDFLDLLLVKDVPPLIVLELFLLALGWITALSFPCGVLVAALMTYGRLAQDNEVTAMRALGVNVGRILRGPLGAAMVLAALLTLFNNYVLPETNHRFANLRLAIHRKAPAARIEPGIFINAFDNYAFLVREIDPRTGEMTDITIYDYTDGEVPTTILAKRGVMQYLNGSATLKLHLLDGEIHNIPGEAAEGKYRLGKFDEHTLYLHNSGAILKRSDRSSRGEREMNIDMMLAEIHSRQEQKAKQIAKLEGRLRDAGFDSYESFARVVHEPGLIESALIATGLRKRDVPDTTEYDSKALAALMIHQVDIENIDRRIDAFKVEIHKKFSIPFACVVFVLVGAPLGIRTRKGGFANVAIAVAFFIVYYFFLIGGEQLADRRLVSPALAMWMPNIVFGIMGVFLTISVVGWGPSRGMR